MADELNVREYPELGYEEGRRTIRSFFHSRLEFIS